MGNIFFYKTKIGEITIEENDNYISKLYFGQQLILKDDIIKETTLLKEAAFQLNEYLLGKRKIFDLPLNHIGTEFQREIWIHLMTIPFGHTQSYGEVAKNIGNENASRAVGNANNKNPILIFIPCHRVIGSSGDLVGYAGGVGKKQILLDLEKKYAQC